MTEKAAAMSYQEMIESVSNFNGRLLSGRRSRIPFYDPSTGVVQTDGRRTYSAKERGPGQESGQIYTYPSRPWKAKARPPAPDPPFLLVPQTPLSTLDASLTSVPTPGFPLLSNAQAPFLEANTATNAEVSEDVSNSKDNWTPSFEKPSIEPLSAGLESSSNGFPSDEDDFEDESYASRSIRKSAGQKHEKNSLSKAGRARKNVDYTVIAGVEKKFSCNYCDMCYKTRPGLTYHVTKEHPSSQTSDNSHGTGSKAVILSNPNADRTLQRDRDGKSVLCDICEIENPAVKPAPKGERLLSCSGCGHSAHPTCLNFSKNQRESTRHYPWKCIECKSCSICNSAGNDEKLLFCDDCDRGYHMYCVKPPLETTPEGLWSCDSCLAQYGEEAADRVWKRRAQQEAVARYQREMEDESRRLQNHHVRNTSPRFSASMERH